MKSFSTKNLSLLVALSSAVACGAFVGCSSSDTVINTGNDSGTGTGNNDGSTGTNTDGATGTNTDGATGDDSSVADAGPATIGTGSVSYTQTGASTYYAAASFTYGATAAANPDYNCADAVDLGNGCSFTSCTAISTTVVDAGADAGDAGDAAVTTEDAAVAAAPNADVITITGGALPSSGVTLTPDNTSGLYAAVTSGAGSFYQSGAMITFASASGNATSLGAFSTSVLAPASPTYSAPTFSSSATPTASFDRSADLTVTWSGGTAGTSLVYSLSTDNTSTGALKTVSCTFDGGAGTGVIPSAGGLANLDQAMPFGTANAATGSFNITPQSSAVADSVVDNDTTVAGAGDFTVTTTLSNLAVHNYFTNSN